MAHSPCDSSRERAVETNEGDIIQMLIELSIEDFSKVLGSDSPAPGGGSVAALSGALGADLVCMVCKLSVGKPELEQFNERTFCKR